MGGARHADEIYGRHRRRRIWPVADHPALATQRQLSLAPRGAGRTLDGGCARADTTRRRLLRPDRPWSGVRGGEFSFDFPGPRTGRLLNPRISALERLAARSLTAVRGFLKLLVFAPRGKSSTSGFPAVMDHLCDRRFLCHRQLLRTLRAATDRTNDDRVRAAAGDADRGHGGNDGI